MKESGYLEKHVLPVLLMEPVSSGKRQRYRKMLMDPRRERQMTLEETKQKLKEIRSYSLVHSEDLVAALTTRMSANPEVMVTFAKSPEQAVETIKGIAQGSPIAINRSVIISNELKKLLVASECEVIESYDEQFELLKEDPSNGHWPFLEMTFEARFQSFEAPTDLMALRSAGIKKTGTKDFVGLLGVNAISAEDGTIMMLQHMSNISKVFTQGRELILVAGLDKIVRNTADAVFQTKCMAVFGAEALPLTVPHTIKEGNGITELPFIMPAGEIRPRIHLVLLDNDRTVLLQSQFKDFFMCIGCRSCNAFCPAKLSGKPLAPRELVSNFKKYLPQVGPNLLEGEAELFPAGDSAAPSGGAISEDEIWACTTCRICQEVCPVGLHHGDAISGLRQNLAMISTSNSSSKAIRNPLKNVELRGHPWMGMTLAREDWVEGLDVKTLNKSDQVDILYWVGCTGILDDRSIKAIQATARLMKQAGINFGILGKEESCCGDPARRLGNEYLFQLQAEKNIGILQGYGVRRIVTSCPHCYNMLKDEYPAFGGEFEVFHHTELMNQLFREGRLTFGQNTDQTITYHDPCYLGRYNSVYQAPRQVLHNTAAKIVEMPRNREHSFCCGGGGGRMWLEENIGRRISEMRVEQAADTGARTLVTACPFCLQMFDDATKAIGVQESLKVVDIAELMISLELTA